MPDPRPAPIVLLIDHDTKLLELQRSRLDDEGFVVVTARDGERALHVLKAIAPHVVVTEMMMPVIDGFDFLGRYTERPGRAPVVGVSSFLPYLDLAAKLGANVTLTKPLDPEQLVEVLRLLTAGEPLDAPHARHPSSGDEAARLQAIFRLQLDKPAPEPALQAFVNHVAHHFQVPICLISIVTAESQQWTAGCGIPAEYSSRAIPRRESFCTHAVAARAALVVQDTLDHPFFRKNELVRNAGLRFYAGVPLITRHGEAVGTLCLMDYKPRRFSHPDLELLSVFGRRVLAAAERREQGQGRSIPEGAFQYLHTVDEDLDIFSNEAFRQLAVVESARGAETRIPVGCAALALPARRLREAVDALRERFGAGIVGRLGHARLGLLVPGVAKADLEAVAREVAGPHGFATATELDRHLGTVPAALSDLELSLGDAGLA